MARIKRPAQAPPEISQASTADIAFLLLIFFISTTVFEQEFGMQVLLPGLGGKSVKVKRDNVLTVRAGADGEIYVEDAPTALRELRGVLEGRLEANENLIISIETEGDAAYQRMIDVLDEVKAAGAERFSIKQFRG
ncbi:MAG: biopolymer transporter ExbD [Candidatus Eisenbacteria sp.]|nr:biopolymer transporter ExbD [Candidatus Eisenbacteria bacterium]